MMNASGGRAEAPRLPAGCPNGTASRFASLPAAAAGTTVGDFRQARGQEGRDATILTELPPFARMFLLKGATESPAGSNLAG